MHLLIFKTSVSISSRIEAYSNLLSIIIAVAKLTDFNKQQKL